MLDRAFLKSFFTWLEEATLAELEARREQLRSAMPGLYEPEARRDARFLAKHLEREILDRHFAGPGKQQ